MKNIKVKKGELYKIGFLVILITITLKSSTAIFPETVYGLYDLKLKSCLPAKQEVTSCCNPQIVDFKPLCDFP